MKTPPSRPRLICRVVRHWCAAESSHVAACADCRRFFAATRALESALVRAAAQLPDAADDHLEQRLLQSVRRARADSARAAESGRSRHRGGLWVAGGALAALAFAMVVFQRPPADGGRPAGPGLVTPAEAAALVGAVETYSTEFVDSMLPAAGAMVADNPLQREFGSIYTDARSALGFLALNFLPGATTPVPPRSG